MSADVMTKVREFFLGQPTVEEDYEVEEVASETKRSPRNISVLHGAPTVETLVLEPRSFDDALTIINFLKEKKAVILNLHTLPAEQEQRLVDFVAGATHALEGFQERVSDHIFAFSPSNHKISAQRQNEAWGQMVATGHTHLAYKVK